MKIFFFLLLNTAAFGQEIFFSPNGGCTDAIIHKLDSAAGTIYIQAYSFTSAPIAQAIIRAKQRGCSVFILLDKSQETAKGSQLTAVRNAGIPVLIDNRPAIAHNKVIVIDSTIVITGSFNFTASAESRNAENLIILKQREVALAYLRNFDKRKLLSRLPK